MWLAILACSEEPSQTVEPIAAVAEVSGDVSADVYVDGDLRGDALLYWPSLTTVPPIAVRPSSDPAEVPWTGPAPIGQPARVWIARDDLPDLQQRTARAGAPKIAEAGSSPIEANLFPGMELGQVSITMGYSDPVRGSGSSSTFLTWVGSDGPSPVFAGHPGMLTSMGLDPSKADYVIVTPIDSEIPDGWVALDAGVPDGVDVGDLIRLQWPEGTEVDEDEVEAGYLYLGPDERGWVRIATNFEKALVYTRATAGVPPVVVADPGRVAVAIPLSRPAGRIARSAELTDGKLRTQAFPWAMLDDQTITVVVPAEDEEWLRYWLKRSGGKLRVAGFRQIDRTGWDRPPPGFPASTKLRR